MSNATVLVIVVASDHLVVAIDLMQRQRMQRSPAVALDLMQRCLGPNATDFGVALGH